MTGRGDGANMAGALAAMQQRYAEAVVDLRDLEERVEQALAAEWGAAETLRREGVVAGVLLTPVMESARRTWARLNEKEAAAEGNPPLGLAPLAEAFTPRSLKA